MRSAWLLLLLLCRNSPLAHAEMRSVCQTVEHLPPAQLSAQYPSCGVWLRNACTSPFHFDHRSQILQRSTSYNHSQDSCSLPPPQTLSETAEDILLKTLNCLQDWQPPETRPKTRQAVALEALKEWERINQKRESDLEVILKLYSSEQFPLALKNSEISASIQTLVRHIDGASALTAEKNRASWLKFVGEQIADAAMDETNEYYDRAGKKHRDVELGIFSRLQREKSDSDRFKELVSRAHQIDPGVDDAYDGNLTPYHSKMILLYALVDRIQKKYISNPARADQILNTLARNLKLKADFTTSGPTQWKWIIPHDGFTLGASFGQMRNLLDMPGSAESEKKGGTGSGIDCATFVQKVLEKSGFYHLPSGQRLTSAKVVEGALNPIGKIQILSPGNMKQIAPGDLIIEREPQDPDGIGHVQIVVGYEGDPPNLVVVSAEGGYHRSLIKRLISIFPNQPNSCSKDNYFSLNSENQYYRLHINKEGSP